jgi:hypothetical protein
VDRSRHRQRKRTGPSGALCLNSRRRSTLSDITWLEEIGLNEEHFAAVVESHDVGVLCTVAVEVFTKARAEENAALKDDANAACSPELAKPAKRLVT